MDRYDNTTTLAPVFGLCAALLTGAVLTLAVYVPASTGPGTLVAANANRIEVAIEPSRIDVVGVRTARTAANAHVSEAVAPST
jgi:hypothetical protein